jgi:hypothetical protein
VTTAIIADDPQLYENQHVHGVYDQIASHFSSTRYKACGPNSRCGGQNKTERVPSLAVAYHYCIPIKSSNRMGRVRFWYWEREIFGTPT